MGAHDTTPSPQTISAIEDALRAMAKAFRAVQLYLPNNPSRGQSLEWARTAFAKVWAHEPVLELHVHEASFQWEGRVVFQDAERATESLPWLLHRDGLRAIAFQPGCEAQDLEALLSLLQRARAAASDDDDLVTMLWVADLAHVTYRYVDVGNAAEPMLMSSGDRPGVANFAPGQAPLAVPPAETQPPGEGPPGMVRVENFDTTLYFLDQRETAYLQDELRREYTEDQRRLVLASLFDILESRPEAQAQQEVLSILDQLVIEFLTMGDYELVAYVLREASTAVRKPHIDPSLVKTLEALPGRLSEPQVVAQLLHALDESARTPVTSLLEGLFSELRAEALEPLVSWLGGASASPARASIEKASLRLAGAHTAELNRLLEHPKDTVVRGALRLVAQLGTAAAVPGLARLLRVAETQVRAEAVGVLADIGSPSALQALERAIDDADRDVRVATYRAIGTRKHAGALPRLLDAIRRKDTRGADLGEKMALFEAFGAMCGNSGVNEMDTLLNARGLLGAKENAEMRACAARALGLIGTPMAMSALQRAADTKDLVVRNAVARAMRGGQ
ncbi:MAG TPA: HEAT repeat domain-containing protein [Gemmatimonas sp.]|uniref:HEAT repeat domain-containing protein n=1 Tax=Gemmatimonas sp. TaxID=1962908 RepID=UPI002ED865B1